jgi:serine/threonine protein kinase
MDQQGSVIGRGSHGVVREVPGEPHLVVKQIEAIKRDHSDEDYFSIDAVLEPAAIRRLNCCGCPYVVEMDRCEVSVSERRVDLYLQKLQPICESTSILSKVTANRIVAQLVAGIASMNACGVFHRDIKTVNVMRTDCEEGNVRIIDFSLALLDSPRLTRECDIMYTLNYRAPEVILAYPHYDREKAESWALGVTCAEILLGIDGHNLFRGLKWYHVLSGIIEAFPNLDFGGAYCFFPGWRDFISDEQFREGWWRFGGASLHKVANSICGDVAADFLCCACEPRPEKRWTPAMLLTHPFIRDQACCRNAIEAIQQHQQGHTISRLQIPRKISITQPPSLKHRIFLQGLGDMDSYLGQTRRAMAEGLLRFIGIDASGDDRDSYEGALVLTGALCREQAQYYKPEDVMRVLAMAGVFEFFSRHVYVLINDK